MKELLKDVLKAYENFKTRAIFMDIVIINRESESYKEIINHKVEQELYRMNTLYNFYSTPGRVYVLDSKDVSPEEDILFNMIARLRFDTKKDTSLEDSINLDKKCLPEIETQITSFMMEEKKKYASLNNNKIG